MASKVTLGDELLFPSKYLCHADLAGADLTLTIGRLEKQELVMKGGGKKTKWVMTFRDHAKELVLNQTNAESIAHMHGVKAEAWIGKRVTFFPTRAKFGKDMVDAIRVREHAPKETQAAPAAAKPFAWTEEELARLESWQTKLDPETVNLDKLNGDILNWLKEIPASDRIRGAVWAMIVAMAGKFDCSFDSAAKKFVQKPNA